METQVRKRKALYCNAKVLLLFLVIYGHLIETRIEESEILLWQYRLIYAVHMPMFAFLSGLFLKTKESCLKQMKTAILVYVPCQLLAMFLEYHAKNQIRSFFVPYWYLWYLLSLFFWALTCFFVIKVKKRWVKAVILIVCVMAACLFGCMEEAGRFLSLSRTICFLPYVLLGCYLPRDFEFSKYRQKGIVVLGLAMVMAVFVLPLVPAEFLYYADSYQKLGMLWGAEWRFICMIVTVSLGAGILCLLPEKKLPFSIAGADTFWVYLFHGPFVKELRTMEIHPTAFLILAPILAAILYYGLFRIFENRRKRFQIVP